MHADHHRIALIGRILLSIIFIGSGIGKIAAPAVTMSAITAAGLPFPSLGLILAIAVELGAGLSLLVGFKTRAIAALLTGFTLVTAVVFHHNFSDQNQMIHFLKNLAIAGGLLQVVANGAAGLSVDAARTHPPLRMT